MARPGIQRRRSKAHITSLKRGSSGPNQGGASLLTSSTTLRLCLPGDTGRIHPHQNLHNRLGDCAARVDAAFVAPGAGIIEVTLSALFLDPFVGAFVYLLMRRAWLPANVCQVGASAPAMR